MNSSTEDLVLSIENNTAFQAAMEINMTAFWRSYARAKGCTHREGPGTLWFVSGVPHPLFNAVVAAQLASHDADRAIAEMRDAIIERGVPALWWLGPRSRPTDLAARLERHGFVAAGQAPGMALDLATLQVPQREFPDVVIRRAHDAESRATWARTVAAGTEFSSEAIEGVVALERSIDDTSHAAQTRYIGYVDGEPVAGSALVLDGGVAGIYAVATLPAFRGRGIGTLMTLRPLLDAREMGMRVAVLQASEMGEPIYRRLGFRDVFLFSLAFHPGTAA